MSQSPHDSSSEEFVPPGSSVDVGAATSTQSDDESEYSDKYSSSIEWPSSDSEKEISKWAKFQLFLKNQKNRQFFFNPSTWMVPTLALFGISLLIQAVNPGLFLAEAAVPLFIMQTVFASIAVLMLVGAILSLAYYGIEKLRYKPGDGYAEIVDGKIIDGKPAPQSAVVNYLSAFKAWCGKRPEIAIPVIALGVAGVLTLLVLTIGFFTGGFGLSSEAFSFMGSVFDFIGSGFTSGIQGASALPGLGALGSISAATMQLIGQVAAVFMLFAAAIFVPDTIRRALQTRWPERALPTYVHLDFDDEQGHKCWPVADLFGDDHAASYTTPPPVSQPGVQNDPQSLFTVTVKYSRNATSDHFEEGDLIITKGEILDVLDDETDENWWKVRKFSGQVGIVPTSYLEIEELGPEKTTYKPTGSS